MLWTIITVLFVLWALGIGVGGLGVGGLLINLIIAVAVIGLILQLFKRRRV